MTRKIIDGVAYDTDASELVCEGDDGHSLETFWWLYRTPSGAWFNRIADTEGRDEWRLLTDMEAQNWLERNANPLVEKYFGRMSDVQPKTHLGRFSRRTGLAAIAVIESASGHSSLTRLFLTWGSKIASRCESGNISDRCSKLIMLLDAEPQCLTHEGDVLQDVIVEKAVEFLPQSLYGEPNYKDDHLALLRTLDRDGFRVVEGKLLRDMPGEYFLPQAEDETFTLLKKHNLGTPEGHLRQALESHTKGSWAAANAQIRTFMEAMLDDIAELIDPTAGVLKSGHPRRAKLAGLKFFYRDMNEWDDKGTGFFEGLMNRLHPHGSHPGLSDQEDSTFRLHVVMLTARLLLRRFDQGPK